MQAARQRRRSVLPSNGDQSNGTATTTAAADQMASSGGGKSTAGKKNWLRHRLFNMSKGSLKTLDDDDSDATSRASSAADLQVPHLHSDLHAPTGHLGHLGHKGV